MKFTTEEFETKNVGIIKGLSRFAETRLAETLTLTLNLNPNFGESVFGESGRHRKVTVPRS